MMKLGNTALRGSDLVSHCPLLSVVLFRVGYHTSDPRAGLGGATSSRTVGRCSPAASTARSAAGMRKTGQPLTLRKPRSRGRRCSGASDGKRAGVARDEQRDQARPRLGLCRHSAGLGHHPNPGQCHQGIPVKGGRAARMHSLARPGLVHYRQRDRAGVAAIGRDILGHHKPSASARPNSTPPAKNNTSG